MGARARIHAPEPARMSWAGRQRRPLALNIARDGRGEYFDIAADMSRVSLEVIDVRRDTRHLLLMSRAVTDGAKEKFLCGHDERAWFVAAIPGRSASNVA